MDQDVFVKTLSRATILRGDGDAARRRLASERKLARFAATVTMSDHAPIAPAVRSEANGSSIEFGRVHGRQLTDVLDEATPRDMESAVRRLAEAVAALHTSVPGEVLPAAETIALSPTALRPADLAGLTGAALEMYRAVQQDPPSAELLAAAAADHRRDAFVHNDLRAVNVLVTGDGDVRIVDWEFAGRGSVARDIGTVLADLVAFGLRAACDARVPAAGGEPDRSSTRVSMYARLAPLFVRTYQEHTGSWPDLTAVASHVASGLFHSSVSRTQRDGRHYLLDRATVKMIARLARGAESLRLDRDHLAPGIEHDDRQRTWLP